MKTKLLRHGHVLLKEFPGEAVNHLKALIKATVRNKIINEFKDQKDAYDSAIKGLKIVDNVEHE